MSTTQTTFEDLRKKTINELRDMARSLPEDAVQGYTQMNKEHLLPMLCRALGIEHEHHTAMGVDKAAIKAKMRGLKSERSAAIDAHDGERLRVIRRHLHALNHQLRVHAR